MREVKEAIAVVRLELAKHQLDIVDSLVGWDGICRYVVAMHNLHGKKFGKTPRELLRDSPASKENPVSAMFCSQVLAETPESVNSIGRFVTAAYLWPVRNSFAHFVVAKIEGELKYFQAKSLKLVLPLHFPDELIQRFVVSTHDGPQRKIEDYSPVEVVPSDFMKLPGRIPPPRSWVDAAGKTPGCKACDSGKGKHSVACQARYSEWLESHDVSASGSKVVVSPSPGDVEPDLLDDQQEVVGHEYVPTTPEGSDGEKVVVSHDREKRRKVEVESSPDPYFTRRCPACESGMDVCGIRRNSECRKKRASLQAQPPSTRPEVSLPSSCSTSHGRAGYPCSSITPSRFGHYMDQPMVDSPAGPDEDSVAPMEFGLVDLNQRGVLFDPSSLSGLDLMSDVRFHVESIAYDGSKGECKVIDFCGSRVKLWKPSHVISDTTLGELDPEGTFKAMQKECDGLTAVKAGVILSEQKKEEFCKLHGVKPITCRWVTNEKPESDEGVRARIVVKDIARGSATARSLAISSPTPSVESLRMVLGASCGIWGAELALYAIDVSQAFMNSPLRDKERIVLKMPLSISTTSGEPIFLEAHKALNGLRVASLTWSVFLKEIVSKVGLACSTTEPCLYGGVIDGSPTLLLCYVDDLLIASSTDKAFHRVFKELSKHVKVRETGRIAFRKDGGGSLKFLGRVISRRASSPSLVMQVDPSYMDAACEEFGIKVPKGVVGPPDIKPSLEATSEESPISPEAHSRYRRVLGRLAWLAQTRMDLLHYTSLLASGQAEPKPGHEKALRQVLRFVEHESGEHGLQCDCGSRNPNRTALRSQHPTWTPCCRNPSSVMSSPPSGSATGNVSHLKSTLQTLPSPGSAVKRMLCVFAIWKVRSLQFQLHTTNKKRKLADGLFTEEQDEDDGCGRDWEAYLDKLQTLMLAYSMAGAAGVTGAPAAAQEHGLGSDSCRFVQVPLDVMQAYYYRAKRTTCLLPPAKRLAWLQSKDAEERSEWVARFRESTASLGQIVKEVYTLRDAHWVPPPILPFADSPAGVPSSGTSKDNSGANHFALGKPINGKQVAKVLKDGSRLCQAFQHGQCKQKTPCPNGQHRCGLVVSLWCRRAWSFVLQDDSTDLSGRGAGRPSSKERGISLARLLVLQSTDEIHSRKLLC